MPEDIGRERENAVRIAMVTVPPNSASGIFGMRDVLNSVGIGWETYVTGGKVSPAFEVFMVGAEKAPFICGSGAQISPDFDYGSAPAPDVVITSGMFASATERMSGIDRGLIEWIAAQHARGATVVSSCTGAILLAEAGLLDGVEATTHWAFRDLFRKVYPEVHLRLERNLCCVAPDHRIVTAGGTTMWQELALYLIARFDSVEQATRTAKFWLLPNDHQMQAPYTAMPHGIPHQDAAISACQAWIADNYATEDPVSRMMSISGLSKSTFRRRFQAATGFQPIDYVQTIRMEEAKQLLETTAQTVPEIAEQVGYEDPSYFARLFRRRTGVTPAEHRVKFGNARFRRLLRGDAGPADPMRS